MKDVEREKKKKEQKIGTECGEKTYEWQNNCWLESN